MGQDDEAALRCWLCQRPIANRLQWHHPVPKARKGRETVPVHPICHQTIHANFSNAALARIGADRDAMLADAAIGKFVSWVRDKPPDFHAPTRKGG